MAAYNDLNSGNDRRVLEKANLRLNSVNSSETWNGWPLGMNFTIENFATRNVKQNLLDGHDLKCRPLPCLVQSYPNEPGVEHDCMGVTVGHTCEAWCKDGWVVNPYAKQIAPNMRERDVQGLEITLSCK